MDNSMRAGSFVFGGLFLGVWLYVLLFPVEWLDEDKVRLGLWTLWGGAGLVIAGGIFAGRFARPGVRIALWVVTGIAVGLLAGGFLFSRQPEALAALLTGLGGALICSAIPLQQQEWAEIQEGDAQ